MQLLPTRNSNMNRFFVIVLYLYISDATARCSAIDNPSDPCRYPQGDAWCMSTTDNPYAYRLGCEPLEIRSERQRQYEGEPFIGSIGVSSRWGSGWIDLRGPIELYPGDKLRLFIGGAAERILVRLLRQDQFPDSSANIVGNFRVPEDRIVEIELARRYARIVQISVHGEREAWGVPLGADNRSATLEFAELVRSP